MQTTEDIAAAVASASSKSVQSRRTLYVGGLDDAVTQSLLHASFIPFGPIKSVELVQDYSNNRRKYNPNNSKRGGRGGPSFGNTNTYRGKFSSSIPTAPAHKGFGFVVSVEKNMPCIIIEFVTLNNVSISHIIGI